MVISLPYEPNKAEIIENIHNQHGLSKSKSTNLVKSLIELMKPTLASGEDVLISGFGKFYLKYQKERKIKHPSTGQTIIIRPTYIIYNLT